MTLKWSVPSYVIASHDPIDYIIVLNSTAPEISSKVITVDRYSNRQLSQSAVVSLRPSFAYSVSIAVVTKYGVGPATSTSFSAAKEGKLNLFC